jgi:hypothetical protein
MNRTVKMTVGTEVLRGWPNDGSLDTSETVTSGQTVAVGDIVERVSGGTVQKIATKAAGVGTAACGFVVKTGTIAVAGGAATQQTAVVIWGNAIIRTIKAAATPLVLGEHFTGGDASTTGLYRKAATTDVVKGYCIKVETSIGPGAETAYTLVLF